MFYRATRDRFLDHGVASEGVVGAEVRCLPVCRVRFRYVVHLVKHPASRIVDMLAHVESQTAAIVCD